MSKALEAAARELVKYNTIPELYEQEWPSCVNPARAAILAFLREVDRAATASAGYPIPNSDHADAHRIANEVLAALTRLAEETAP